MLRTALIVLAALVFVGAIGLLVAGVVPLTTVIIGVAADAVILLIALIFERGRYRPSESSGQWTPTSERFQDPANGRWIRVEYNARTGERRYVDEGQISPSP